MFEAMVFDQLSRHLPADQIANIRWMEKTPDHAEHLDVMNRFYPESKFIFIVRNPEKAILSRRKHFTWNDESNWPIERHLDRWIQTINSVDEFNDSFPGQVHYVRFEDVVDNQVNEIAGVCRFLGIPFASELLENYPRFSKQQSLDWEDWKSNTEQGISQSIADGRPESLTPYEKAQLRQRLAKHLDRFDYHEAEAPFDNQPSDEISLTEPTRLQMASDSLTTILMKARNA